MKTEVLNYSAGEWEQAPDYPFSNGDRYVRKDLIEDLSFIFIKRTIHSFSGYHIMLLLQPVKVFSSSAALPMVHLPKHQQLPNTKTEAGKMLETWLKLDMLMVQSHQDLSQWLLVVHQVMDQRKFISERNYSIILIF